MVYKFNCEICGKEVIRSRFLPTMRFCSKECHWKDKKYRKKMKEAIKKRNDNPTESMIKARFQNGHHMNDGKHHSPQTEFKSGELNPFWKGGKNGYRGKDWKIQKQKALERDKFICQRCGNEAVIVHHIIPYSVSKDNSLDNLISLCRRCHIITERGYSKLIIDGEDILISHVPEKALKLFEDLSEKEFRGNNAMTLKWLMDMVFGMMPTGNEEIYARLDMIENKLAELTKKPEVPKPNQSTEK